VNRRSVQGSRAFYALLLFALLLAPACGSEMPGGGDGSAAQSESTAQPGATAQPKKEATRVSPEQIEKAAKGELEAEGTTSTTASKPAESSTFVHRATQENSRGDYTYLDDPKLNGDPNAVVLAAPTGARGGGGDYGHNVGVWFEPEARKWAIFNQDRAAVPDGATFQVVIPAEPERFVHRSSPDNASENGTYLDDPLVNGKPDVAPSVTQNWNPGGGRGVYNDHAVDVRYDADRGAWEVFNEDGSALPEGVSFNVGVPKVALAAGVETVDGGDDIEVPKYRDFYSEGDPQAPKLISSDSSAGAIPVVQPFNFGRDPGGPEDKTLSIDIPKIGVEGIRVFDTVSEEKLRDGTVHIPASGYPWQKGANVFIAGHRIGFEGTPSYYVFFRLDELVEGDEIRLTNAVGREFLYRVTRTTVVGPNDVQVMNAVEGKSLITLQTCTLPDYEERLIVQGELVEPGA
jgi:LPXTG-site transpeptidase (sortase) family protein